MSSDSEVVDIRLKSPFTSILQGPTGCGKTQLIFKLIELRRDVCTSPPDEIIYCYGVYQSTFDDITGVTFREGMLDSFLDIPDDGKSRWLIIDDLMQETAGTKVINDIFTKGSHHRNISVFYLLQNLFVKDNVTVSRNTHYMFLFKSLRDLGSVKNVARQAAMETNCIIEAYSLATAKPYSHLLLDFHHKSDDRTRIIGNFASDEMIAYVPKSGF